MLVGLLFNLFISTRTGLRTNEMSIPQSETYARPTLEDYFGPDQEESDASERYADPLTVKTREKASAFAASFNALMNGVGIDAACEEAGVDASEVRRVLMVLLEMAAAAERQATSQGRSPTKKRRFHCPDYVSELTYRRDVLPRDLPAEEKARRIASLSRQWRRRWRSVHLVLCRTHLPLVERERGGLVGKKRRATIYTDHMADLLARIAERAKQFKKGLPVTRYNRAAEEILADFREEVTPYAPEWTADVNTEVTNKHPKVKSSENEDPPYIRSLRRAVELAKKEVREATPDESSARLTELHEWLNALWSGGDGGSTDTDEASPVLHNVDTDSDTENDNLDRTRVSYLNEQETAKTLEKTQNPPGDGATPSPPVYSVEYDAEPEPRGQSLAEAEVALDAFVSVGARACVAVVVDDALPFEESYVSDAHLTADEFRCALPYYLEHNSENETYSLCVRFAGKEPSWDWYGTRRLIQADDCSAEEYARLLPFSFFAIRTSPSNPRGYQVWMALSDEITDHEEFKRQKRRLYAKFNPTKDKRKLNGGAHGSVRWPGLLNRKPKHRYADGESPRVQLLSVTPGRITSLAELDAAGLLAPPPKGMTPDEVRELKAKLPDGGWPDINDYLSRAGDRSGPECGWAMASFKRGFPRHAIIAKLKEVGPKASTRDDDYAEQTVTAAWNFLVEQSGERAVA